MSFDLDWHWYRFKLWFRHKFFGPYEVARQTTFHVLRVFDALNSGQITLREFSEYDGPHIETLITYSDGSTKRVFW